MTAKADDRTRSGEPGILRRPYARTTVGAWSIVFLAAFESLAVTTVMPVITAGLGGRSSYALAFAAPFAAGVVGMVAVGAWTDRRGPARPFFAALIVFAAGLAAAGTAGSMTVFVAARFTQGLGAGGLTVALYVLVARVYPAVLHPMIFGAFASAWVLPSLVGPFAAGAVADTLGWQWVFLGVIALVAAAAVLILPAVRRHDAAEPGPPPLPGTAGRVAAAVVVAAGVVVSSVGAALDGPLVALVSVPSTVVVVVAVRRLLPAGTYRARAGLPATVLLCGVAGATFFGTEVYLPLLLHDRYGLPSWLSGVTLTTGAVAWALASALQGRAGDRLSHRAAVRAGAALLVAGAAAELLTTMLTLPVAFAAAGWFVAGAGMGTLYPRISTLVFAYSAAGEQGFNTSAKSIADTVAASLSLGIAGLLFGAVGAGGVAPFTAVFAFTTAVAVLTLPLSLRVGRPG